MTSSPIEELWPELEAARTSAASSNDERALGGWVLRMVRPDPRCPLYVGMQVETGQRGLLVLVEKSAVPSSMKTLVSRSLELVSVSVENGEALFGVTLKDPKHADTFDALAGDLARRVSSSKDSNGRVSALLEGISRWQKFLAAGNEGLTLDEQAGLWGELSFLKRVLLRAFTKSQAVGAWQGMDAAHQDFLFSTGAVEVKVTTGKKPHSLKIASERQLDDKGLPALFLHHESLAARDGAGQTLPQLIEAIRADMALESASLASFDDRLLRAGYLDIHQQRYCVRGYTLRETNDFVVKEGFPRITEADLSEGIGSVTYLLSVDACASFSIEPKRLLERLQGKTKKVSKG